MGDHAKIFATNTMAQNALYVMIQLYDYQIEGTQKIREAFSGGARRVLYQLSTGGGKTVVFCDFALACHNKGNYCIIATHRKDLVWQASMRLCEMEISHELVCDPKKRTSIISAQIKKYGRSFIKTSAKIFVGTIQTIVNRRNSLPKMSFVVYDEAHHSVGKTFRSLAEEIYSESFVLGVTATPARLDGKGMGREYGGLYNKIVFGPPMRELIRLGRLVPCRLFFPGKKLDMLGVKITGGDYDLEDQEQRIKKQHPTIIGDTIEQYKKICDHKKTIVFTPSVAMAKETAQAFCDAGYKFKSLDGSMRDEERDAINSAMLSGDLDGITSCEIVSEGYDVPRIEVAILLRLTKSDTMFMQWCGRAMRTFLGKEYGIIIDQVGNLLEHFPPEVEREYSLAGLERASAERCTFMLRICPECKMAFKASKFCPNCGHEFISEGRQIGHEDGELVEITDMLGQLADKKKARKEEALRTKERNEKNRKARTFYELLCRALEDDYSFLWCIQTYRSRGREILAEEREEAKRFLRDLESGALYIYSDPQKTASKRSKFLSEIGWVIR